MLLGASCVDQWWWPELRWLGSTAATKTAAAGVQARLGMVLWGTAGRTAGCYGLLVMC